MLYNLIIFFLNNKLNYYVGPIWHTWREKRLSEAIFSGERETVYTRKNTRRSRGGFQKKNQ